MQQTRSFTFVRLFVIFVLVLITQTGFSAPRNDTVGLAFGARGAAPRVPPVATTITSDNPDPSNVGQGVTINFAVQGAKYRPSGTVTITSSDGLSCQGVLTLGDPSTGSCTITFTSAGVKSLVASYSGDDTYDPSTSAAEPHTVNGPRDVPEGDTLLLLGGGLGGLATWLCWQWSERKRVA